MINAKSSRVEEKEIKLIKNSYVVHHHFNSNCTFLLSQKKNYNFSSNLTYFCSCNAHESIFWYNSLNIYII